MKVLIIQQKMIGDVLLSTVLSEQVKKNIPTAEIHYLINTNTEAIVTNIDNIIFFTKDLQNNKWLFYKFDVYTPVLHDFLGILYHSSALIGNEGGAINMAKALNVPTLSIFSPWVTKNAWDTFNHSEQNTSVHLKDYNPFLFKDKSNKELKKDTHNLYNLFKPSLFKNKTHRFLNLNVHSKKHGYA